MICMRQNHDLIFIVLCDCYLPSPLSLKNSRCLGGIVHDPGDYSFRNYGFQKSCKCLDFRSSYSNHTRNELFFNRNLSKKMVYRIFLFLRVGLSLVNEISSSGTSDSSSSWESLVPESTDPDIAISRSSSSTRSVWGGMNASSIPVGRLLVESDFRRPVWLFVKI